MSQKVRSFFLFCLFEIIECLSLFYQAFYIIGQFNPVTFDTNTIAQLYIMGTQSLLNKQDGKLRVAM